MLCKIWHGAFLVINPLYSSKLNLSTLLLNCQFLILNCYLSKFFFLIKFSSSKTSGKKRIISDNIFYKKQAHLSFQEEVILYLLMDGTEFNRLSDMFSKENIYYAHPYASWERGTNDNHNRLIRRWLPKGTKKTTPKEVAFIEKWMNNYPKKCLNYKSSREDFWMAYLNLKFSNNSFTI